MPDFTRRSQDIEIMDDLECRGPAVDRTLTELEVINRLLGGNKVTLDGVDQLLKSKPRDGVLTIVDVGCGGGDILKLLAAFGRRENILLNLIGIDANPNIISFAEKNSHRFDEIKYRQINIFSDEFQKSQFDIVLATLFTHHFSDDELIEFLRSLKLQATVGVVINDIHRHWLAFYSISFLTRLFSKSPMVKFDAPLSVLRAFKRREWESLLAKAGIKNYRLSWKWAFRWQLVIWPNKQSDREK